MTNISKELAYKFIKLGILVPIISSIAFGGLVSAYTEADIKKIVVKDKSVIVFYGDRIMIYKEVIAWIVDQLQNILDQEKCDVREWISSFEFQSWDIQIGTGMHPAAFVEKNWRIKTFLTKNKGKIILNINDFVLQENWEPTKEAIANIIHELFHIVYNSCVTSKQKKYFQWIGPLGSTTIYGRTDEHERFADGGANLTMTPQYTSKLATFSNKILESTNFIKNFLISDFGSWYETPAISNYTGKLFYSTNSSLLWNLSSK